MKAIPCCQLVVSNLRLFSNARLGILTSSERLSSSASASTPPANQALTSPESVIGEKLKKVMTRYEEVTGIKEVRQSQEKVLKAEDRFIRAQDTRRDVSKQLAGVRERLKDIYAELDQTSRGEDHYVTLITQEHKVLKEERRLADLFNRCEQEERENFSMLSSAVKESHEKERLQAERTKYWSIIGSVIGGLIGVCASSISNEFKMRELRKLVRESAQATLMSRQEGEYPKDILGATENIKENFERLLQQQGKVLTAIQDQNDALQSCVNKIQNYSENKFYIETNGAAFDIDQLLDSQRQENRILAAVCLSSVVCVYVFTKIFN